MKIGILLPQACNLGFLRRARRLSQLIGKIEGGAGGHWSSAIGAPFTSEGQWRTLETMLKRDNPRATVRHLQWEPVSVANARRMFTRIDHIDLDGIDEVVVPRDWGWNFQDCDAVICFANPGLGAVLPLVPTAFYCADLAVRIAPDNFASSIDDDYWQRQTDAFRMWRQTRVLVSDPGTRDDLASYAGVRSNRITTCPNLLDGPVRSRAKDGPKGADRSTLIWLFGSGPLNDIDAAAKGLSIYLSEGGALRPRLAHDASCGRDAAPLAGLDSLRPDLADAIYALPEQWVDNDEELSRLLRRSGALWSSRIAGGEGEGPLLAGEAGINFIGADYAINRATVNDRGVSAQLYRPGDPLDIAQALHALEDMLMDGEGAAKPALASPDASDKAAFRQILTSLAGARVAD